MNKQSKIFERNTFRLLLPLFVLAGTRYQISSLMLFVIFIFKFDLSQL